MSYVTRFAPSPTGPLHLGHAYSALLAQDRAFAENGDFLLRIDDLDQSRSRAVWEAQLKDDLKWLGLWWPEPCRRESEHHSEYNAALDQLWAKGLLYPCTCTRRDIRDAMSAPQEGPDGLIYPGTCRQRFDPTGPLLHGDPRPRDVTLRLNTAMATTQVAQDHSIDGSDPWRFVIRFTETGHGPNGETGVIEFDPADLITSAGDVVLSRKDMGAAYHLAVVVDDNAQGITEVVRGEDLFEATRIHVLLQRLLGVETPKYHHHGLIRDDQGKRLAKRDDARSISKYREDGATPDDIRRMVGL